MSGVETAGERVRDAGEWDAARARWRAVDIGVYPFIVPLRPVAGSLMEDWAPPPGPYSNRIYWQVAAYMSRRGMSADDAVAGCARCQACSAINAVQQPLLQIGPRPGSAP